MQKRSTNTTLPRTAQYTHSAHYACVSRTTAHVKYGCDNRALFLFRNRVPVFLLRRTGFLSPYTFMLRLFQNIGAADPRPNPPKAINNATVFMAGAAEWTGQNISGKNAVELSALCRNLGRRAKAGSLDHPLWPKDFGCECDKNCAIQLMVNHPAYLTDIRTQRFKLLLQKIPPPERRRWVDKKRSVSMNSDFF